MTENLTRHPIQVSELDVSPINLALSQIQDRIDEVLGLRGTVTIHNEINATAASTGERLATLDQVQSEVSIASPRLATLHSSVGESLAGQRRNARDLETARRYSMLFGG